MTHEEFLAYIQDKYFLDKNGLEAYDNLIKEFIQSAIAPKEKDTMNCTEIESVSDITDMTEGKHYFITPTETTTGTLYEIKNGRVVVAVGDISIVYIVAMLDETTNLFIFDGSKYVDVTSGGSVDNVIYTNDIKELLTKQLDDGIYTVIYNTYQRPSIIRPIRELNNNAVPVMDKYPSEDSKIVLSSLLDITQEEAGQVLVSALRGQLENPIVLPEFTSAVSVETLSVSGFNIETIQPMRIREVRTYSLSVGSSERSLVYRDGWATPNANNTDWDWRYYSYEGHPHTPNDITGLDDHILSFITPEQKEVVQCIQVDSISEITDPEAGQHYIIPDNDELYLAILDSDGFVRIYESEPAEEVIYVANDGTNVTIYIWNDTTAEFEDVTGEEVDNVIYVNSLSLLDNYNEKSVYSVCYTHNVLEGGVRYAKSEWYSLAISTFTTTAKRSAVNPSVPVRQRQYIQQRLSNDELFMQRKRLISADWPSEWETFRYSYEGHTHNAADISGLDEAISGKQDKNDTSLETTSKNIVGAINEINDQMTNLHHAFVIDFQQKCEIVQMRNLLPNITITNISTDNVTTLRVAINGTLQTLTLVSGKWSGSINVSTDDLLAWTLGRTNSGEVASISVKYIYNS